jgi:hypothetical protein
MVVCAVSISPLPGLTLPSFASRHASEWFHRSTAKLCYQSQFLIGLAVLSIENARFLLAILVEEKTTFFVTAPFSHHTPRSNFIEERQAMRYISAVIRSCP